MMETGNSREENKIVKKRRNQTSNKLTLSSQAQKLGDNWLKQVNEYFNGMISLKRNDLINVIIEGLNEKLSTELLERIKKEKLTDKEKAKWIYKQMLDAESKGVEVDFNELVKKAQAPSKRKNMVRKSKIEASQGTPKKSADFSNDPLKKQQSI